jgi:2-polyprenyl-3-methyl-5-hydroxy-6-metoxy-1,4-benzoquinol methylase
MGECCGPNEGYQSTFSDRFAERIARRYRKRGLNKTQQQLVAFLAERGLEGATVLEIGGGVGEIQVELLRRGATHVTNLEISENYEAQAAELLAATGMTDRVDRRFLDIATAPGEVEAADVVVLHRVVCCYPDYERLLGAAGSHARRMLVFSHPPRNWFSRGVIGWDNLLRRLRRNDFRAFVHPPEAMVRVLREQGLTPSYRGRGSIAWEVVGLERTA